MTNVLHRSKNDEVSALDRPTSATKQAEHRPAAWPPGAKVLVAILAVATLLGALGMAIAATTTDDGSAERQLRDQIAALAQERDEALADVASLDAELVTLQQQLADAQSGNDDLSGRVAELEEQIATVTNERDGALAVADIRQAALDTANLRVLGAIAERDALAELFPIRLDGVLGNGVVVGDHRVELDQVYSTGLNGWNAAKAIHQFKITRTSEGWLRLNIPGFVDGGLFRAGDALHLSTSSTSALPSVDGVARQAQVTVTLFPGGYSIADDGTRTTTSVTGVVTVEAPAVGSAPAALGFYAFELS